MRSKSTRAARAPLLVEKLSALGAQIAKSNWGLMPEEPDYCRSNSEPQILWSLAGCTAESESVTALGICASNSRKLRCSINENYLWVY
jgi:hypothetical protein